MEVLTTFSKYGQNAAYIFHLAASIMADTA
jgi:hypothetical protein